MKSEPDLFISYAHIDNQSVKPEQEGWISLFHKALEIRLSQLRGEYPKIWRDPKIQGNDYFNDTILETVSNTALLISILSPRYLKSEWCMQELKRFCEGASNTGGLCVGDNKARLFKVVKTHLPLEQHPSEFTSLIGYDFFEFDEAGRTQEFDKIYGPELERKFYAKLNDLACDIHQTLKVMEALPTEDNRSDISTATDIANSVISDQLQPKAIYLAETTHDLGDARDKIRRELTMSGYRVFPDRPLPFTPDFSKQVKENLLQCVMSIHLVSPIESRESVEVSPSSDALHQLLAVRSREQIEISDHCSEGQKPLIRILWMPPQAQLGKKDEFLQSLQSQPDFLNTTLEVLKTMIQDRITQISSLDNFDSLSQGARKVYLDCDQRDLDTADIEQLYDWLDERFDVVLPDYSKSSLMQCEASLRQCEAVLIYYGQASGLWLKRRLLALKKTLYDRPRPLLAKAVYLARPNTPKKQVLSDPEILVINGLDKFDPRLLQTFLDSIEEV